MIEAPTVSITASSNSSIAGNTYSLTCLAATMPYNISFDSVLVWSGPGLDQSNVEVSHNGSALVLTFSPLHTSHGGAYTCQASLNVSEVVDTFSLISGITENVTVQSKLELYLFCSFKTCFCSSSSSGGHSGTSDSLQWDSVYSKWCCSIGSDCRHLRHSHRHLV